MDRIPSGRAIYEFGPFRFDPSRRELTREGEAIKLTPKVIDTLRVFVENPGKVLEKDFMYGEIWPDTIVEEAALAVYVSTLRKALCKEADDRKYIVTVSGRGYQFVEEVRKIVPSPVTADDVDVIVQESSRITIHEEKEDETESGDDQVVPALREAWLKRLSHRTGLSQKTLVLIATVILTAPLAGAVAWENIRHPAIRRTFGSVRIREVHSEKSRSGRALGAGRFSPDGNKIAFASTGDVQNIIVKQIDGGGQAQVTRDNCRDDSPIWSPDGEEIAFLSNRGDQIGIWRVHLFGGPMVLLKTLETGHVPTGGPPSLVSWSGNGKYIYYEWHNNLYRFLLDLKDSPSEQLTHFQTGAGAPIGFALSPDELSVAYAACQKDQCDIWRLELNGGNPIQVTNDPEPDEHPIWDIDGRSLIYNSERNNRWQIFQVDLTSRNPAHIGPEDIQASLSDISRKGDKLLCYAKRDEIDLVSVDVDTGKEQIITDDVGIESWPVPSPDGSRLAYQSIPGERAVWFPPNSLLMTKKLEIDDKATQLAAKGFSIDWSPNGDKLSFLRKAGIYYSLFVIPAGGGQEKQLAGPTVIPGGWSAFSAYNRASVKDYSWAHLSDQIAYSSKEDGAANVWTVYADGSNATEISANKNTKSSMNSPLWSLDDSSLAYVEAPPIEGKQTWTLWVKTQNPVKSIYSTDSIMRLVGWSSNRDLIVALAENSGLTRVNPTEVRLIRVSVPTEKVEPIQTLSSTYLPNIFLSPDGRNVSFVQSLEGVDNIWLIPATGGEARKVTENTDPKVYFCSQSWAPDGRSIYFGKQTKIGLLISIDNFN